MFFSRTAVHGIYTLCYLNRQKSGTLLSSPAVAAALGIPRDQASKVLQRLKNVGLVESIRGSRGGYVLKKQLDEIPVSDVLDALNPSDNEKRLRPKTCKYDSVRMCSAHSGLQRLNDRIRQALVGETLAGLEGTVCHVLNMNSRDHRPELICVTQGD